MLSAMIKKISWLYKFFEKRILLYSGIAQEVERLAVNQCVKGSSPFPGAIIWEIGGIGRHARLRI